MDVEWCGVLVTPPPKYHTFLSKSLKISTFFLIWKLLYRQLWGNIFKSQSLCSLGMLGGTMAIDLGPPREVFWWFETDYVVKISTFCHTRGVSGTNITTLDAI